jgi:hypothetical protein
VQGGRYASAQGEAVNYRDLFTGSATLLLMAVSIVAAIPDLSLWMARTLYAHSVAVRCFWRFQARAFAEYVLAYRSAAAESRQA